MQISEHHVRERAYYIWEGEGRTHGRDALHWLRAEAELCDAAATDEAIRIEAAAEAQKPAAKARKAAKPAPKAAKPALPKPAALAKPAAAKPAPRSKAAAGLTAKAKPAQTAAALH